MSKSISILGLNKADVIAILFNNARVAQRDKSDEKEMDEEEAEEVVKKQTFDNGLIMIDFAYGRILKITIQEDKIDPFLYDRDNGQNAVENLIKRLRETGETNDIKRKEYFFMTMFPEGLETWFRVQKFDAYLEKDPNGEPDFFESNPKYFFKKYNDGLNICFKLIIRENYEEVLRWIKKNDFGVVTKEI